ncbi:MAG: ornithine cyclodeaminase family protein [Gammaproteobacteria bacterium]|jgi:ornithine cyclodeaminase/alanine dehydrogenase-like protein (mu-crystallin family)|nr:ornithine cyclodeaminase family protein [Gammaproteobacteria bacterium]
MTLHISEAEVDRLLDMPATIEAVENVFRLQGEGRVHNVPRRRAVGESTSLHMMAAAISPLDRIGFKAYTTGPSGARFVVNLYRESTGELDAVVDAGRLGQLRTGAASGVSAKYLAREDAKAAAIIGSGYQAQTQLEAIAHVRQLSNVYVFSRSRENRTAFAAEMADRLGVEVEPVDDPETACSQADIIVAATSSSTPVVMGSWIAPGAHVVAMGANRIQARELDDAAVGGCDLIAVDDIEQSKIESGDLSEGVDKGVISWDEIVHLGDVVAGVAPGRRYRSQMTLFKSLGIALWDVAVAHRLYEVAVREGAGTELPVFGS